MFFGIASLAIAIGSAIYSANIAEDTAEANAAEAKRVAKANAETDLYNASVSRAAKSSVQTAYQESIYSLKEDTGALLADQKTAYSSAGVDVNTGTPLTLSNITKAKSERDISTLLWNQKQKVAELESEAIGYEKAAKLGLLKGDSTASTIMSNAKYNIASIYANYANNAANIAYNTFG